VDIGVEDNDPAGVPGGAIFPSFKGDLFVAKRTKLYRISGFVPEEFQLMTVSNSLGCVSNNSVVQVDADDIYWVSEKGVHSLQATANYGDFSSQYVSANIQRTFTDDFDRSRLPYVQAAYLPTINSIAFAFTEEDPKNYVNTSATVNNTLWFYNVPQKEWYRWPDIACQSIAAVNDSDKKRFYLGSHTTRIGKAFTGANYDVNTAGTQVAIPFKVKTGRIFPAGPYAYVGFKRFTLYYKPTGNHTVSVNVRIDNQGLDGANSLTYTETDSVALLGSTFTLSSSTLGYEGVFAPYTMSIDGVGRGCTIEIEQNGLDQEIEILGYAIEFEGHGTGPENS
jgi:hypothetical protein